MPCQSWRTTEHHSGAGGTEAGGGTDVGSHPILGGGPVVAWWVKSSNGGVKSPSLTRPWRIRSGSGRTLWSRVAWHLVVARGGSTGWATRAAAPLEPDLCL